VRTNRSATAFALGARTGVWMISTPSLRKTVSKSWVNLLSRSRIRNRIGVARSGKAQASWRACWVTQAPLGLRRAVGEKHPSVAKLDHEQNVQPLQRDGFDREEVHGKHALRLRAQDARQERPARSPAGPRPASRSSLRTVVAETAKPRPASSPAIRW
jgi:hypothetical protein